MSRFFTAAAALCVSLLAATPPLAQAQAAGTANARVIVKLKADSGMLRKHALASDERHVIQAAALGQRIGHALSGGTDVGERSQVVFARGITSLALAERLARESDVEYAVPDQRKRARAAPNDPLYAQGGFAGPGVGQWYLRAPQATAATAANPNTIVSAINAEAAWNFTTGSSNIVVAVLDSGVRFDHPDLKRVADGGNLLPGYDMIKDADTANDGEGVRDADPSDPGDWIDQADIDAGKFDGECTSADISDSSWHGTQTAGLIGALTDNGIGMASVGRNVRILPVRVLGKCGGFDSDILAGMRWAAGIHVSGVPDNPNPAKVINMSLGGGSTCTAAYASAIEEIVARGVTIVASAGNGTGHAVSEPASCDGVIGVAGLRHVGSKVGYSDLGPQVSISAPAGNCVNDTGACLYPILTSADSGRTTPAGATYTTAGADASFGTSFSAPLVAGTAALMLSAKPSLAPGELRSLMRATARPFPVSGSDTAPPTCTAPSSAEQAECYCTTSTCGAGMLNAAAAVAAATGLRARIEVDPAAPVVRTEATLSAAQSTAPSGRTIRSYAWTVDDDGDTGVTLSAASGVTTAFTTRTLGRFTVTLTITDSSNATTSLTRAVEVVRAPNNGDSDSDSGGGALGLGWLSALLAAVALLARSTHRRSRD